MKVISKYKVVYVCVIVLSMLFLSNGNFTTKVKAGQTLAVRNYIFIDGNDQFTNEHGVVSGSGTKEDPFIIENWKISISDYHHGIRIMNTDSYFVIRNCIIERENRSYDNCGILLQGVKNGQIENVTIRDAFVGIEIEQSSNILILNSTIVNNEYGISILYSSHNTVSRNVLKNNKEKSIFLYGGSTNNHIIGNIIEGNHSCGIYVDHSQNTYICRNIITGNDKGIHVVFSEPIAIKYNDIYNNRKGVEILMKNFSSYIFHPYMPEIKHNWWGSILGPNCGSAITSRYFHGDSLTIFAPSDSMPSILVKILSFPWLFRPI